MDKLPPPGTAAGPPPPPPSSTPTPPASARSSSASPDPSTKLAAAPQSGPPSPPVRAPRPAAAPPGPRVTGLKRPFGLQERRQGPPRPALVIPNPVAVQGLTFTPVTSPGITSPSSPSIAGRWSPLTSPSTDMAKLSIVEEAAAGQEKLNEAAEERAIKEKRFYLHPSPRSSGQRTAEPELLHLFPTTSPAIGP